MEVEWCEKVGGREREACGKVNKNFGIGRDEDFHVWLGRRPTRGTILRILPRTKVRATDGHLDRSARLFLNAPLLSWAVSKVSRVLGFARGDQYFDRARHKFRRKKLCSPAHLDPFGPNIFFFFFYRPRG